MNFEPIDLKHKEIYEKYTAKRYRNSEASFLNMYMWRKVTNAHVAVVSDMLVLRVYFGGMYRFVMPFGDKANIKSCVKSLYEYCNSNGYPLEIIGANSEFVREIQDAFKFASFEDRNVQDYVYLSEKLATVSGKKLHSKKNHVNKFKSMYDYKFVQLNMGHIQDCINKTKVWMDKKYNGDTEKYSAELDTVMCLFDNYEKFDLFGGAIYVDGKLVAYTVGESLSDDTALVHIEKADTSYHGAFAIINNEFAKLISDRFVYINREEDMGLEGLRKAKESYRPEFLTEKIKCIFDMNH